MHHLVRRYIASRAFTECHSHS